MFTVEAYSPKQCFFPSLLRYRRVYIYSLGLGCLYLYQNRKPVCLLRKGKAPCDWPTRLLFSQLIGLKGFTHFAFPGVNRWGKQEEKVERTRQLSPLVWIVVCELMYWCYCVLWQLVPEWLSVGMKASFCQRYVCYTGEWNYWCVNRKVSHHLVCFFHLIFISIYVLFWGWMCWLSLLLCDFTTV